MPQLPKFKMPPKRFQPKGTSVLYEDNDILVVDKRSGLLTVGNEKVREQTAFYLLNDYVRKGNSKSKNRIYVVQLLDKDTSGVIIFAKTEKAKYFLQDNWQNFKNLYCAVVNGILEKKEGLISSYLTENSVHKVYSTNDSTKGKLAETGFKVLKESTNHSLIELDLLSSRKNQIRVHCAENGFPILGDKKYGKNNSGIKRLALHSYSLTILHPYTKEEMTFTTKIPSYFQSLLKT
ncbi:MAG: RNA pseudouridine synthase [Calditrichaeota bacterium]|nr:MAG: RNA pseudouridine synthase [Calditrichota bacterium]